MGSCIVHAVVARAIVPSRGLDDRASSCSCRTCACLADVLARPGPSGDVAHGHPEDRAAAIRGGHLPGPRRHGRGWPALPRPADRTIRRRWTPPSATSYRAANHSTARRLRAGGSQYLTGVRVGCYVPVGHRLFRRGRTTSASRAARLPFASARVAEGPRHGARPDGRRSAWLRSRAPAADLGEAHDPLVPTARSTWSASRRPARSLRRGHSRRDAAVHESVENVALDVVGEAIRRIPAKTYIKRYQEVLAQTKKR